MPQASLSGTKQRNRGSLLPLTLLIAAAVHLLFFAAVDLYPEMGVSPEKADKLISVRFYEKKQPAPEPVTAVKKTPEQPVLKVQTKPVPEKVSLKAETVQTQETAVKKTEPAETPVPEKADFFTAEKIKIPAAAADLKPDIPDFSNTETLKIKYKDKVRDIIAANKKYPSVAKRRGIQGSVTVAFSVYLDGRIIKPLVVSTSGFDILDKTALEILAESSPLPFPPEQMDLSLPISFKLN